MRRIKEMFVSIFRGEKESVSARAATERLCQQKEDELAADLHDVARRVHVLEWQVMPSELRRSQDRSRRE